MHSTILFSPLIPPYHLDIGVPIAIAIGVFVVVAGSIFGIRQVSVPMLSFSGRPLTIASQFFFSRRRLYILTDDLKETCRSPSAQSVRRWAYEWRQEGTRRGENVPRWKRPRCGGGWEREVVEIGIARKHRQHCASYQKPYHFAR